MKKLFNILLIALLLVGVLPISVYASRAYYNTSYNFESDGALEFSSVSLKEADGGVQVVLNFNKSGTDRILKDIIIDTNSFELTAESEYVGTFFHAWAGNEETDKRIIFPITWQEAAAGESEFVSKSGTLTIDFTREVNNEPEIKLIRTPSSTVLASGQKAALEYVIENKSDREIQVTLTDSQIFTENEIKTLAVGEKWEVHKFRTITGDCVSAPMVQFNDIDGVTQTVKADPESILIEVVKPQITITIDALSDKVDYGQTVNIEYTFQNTGNIPFKNVCIYDTQGNELVRINSLPAKSAKQKRTIKTSALTAKRTFKFKVTGYQDEAKTPDVFYSNEEVVDVNITDAAIRLDLSVQADKLEADKGEEIFFTLTIKNNSSFPVTNASVFLDQNGQRIAVGTIASLAVGESKELTYTTNIQETTSYNFAAVATDTTGTERRFDIAAPIWVTVQPELPSDTNSPAPTQTSTTEKPQIIPPNASNTLVNTIFYIGIVLVVLLLVSGITYLVLYINDKKSRKRSKLELPDDKLKK